MVETLNITADKLIEIGQQIKNRKVPEDMNTQVLYLPKLGFYSFAHQSYMHSMGELVEKVSIVFKRDPYNRDNWILTDIKLD